MGDCTSRLEKKEIEDHINETNNKNNNYFKSITFAHNHSDYIVKEKKLSVLESRKLLYERKKKEFQRKFEESSDLVPPIKEIIIEVQKGVYLMREGICFLKGKPFVTVSLEPNGPCYETFEADMQKPIWYRVFQNKSLIDYTAIHISVKSSENNQPIGSVFISLNEISDQKVHEKWYDLCSTGEQRPSIKIRLQYIYSLRTLYKEFLDTCTKFSEEISEKIEKIKQESPE